MPRNSRTSAGKEQVQVCRAQGIGVKGFSVLGDLAFRVMGLGLWGFKALELSGFSRSGIQRFQALWEAL